ncbi:arylamine N-acetyltransferase 1 [Meredithblackwellia eburnea MCA 4105]
MGSLQKASRSGFRPEQSIYLSSSTSVPPVLAVLNLPDTEAMLTRLGLSPALASLPPSLELLSQVLLAHFVSVPYDVSTLHVSAEDWTGPNKDIQLGGGGVKRMDLGANNFSRIVNKHQGGFCYALNGNFAAFLRGFGFRVASLGARVYMHRGKDPKVEGYLWSPVTHEVLLVDWEGQEGRWFVDAGFGGGGCPRPILLKDGETSWSLSPTESFWLKREVMPVGTDSIYTELPDGFTLYRRVLPPNTNIVSPETAGEGPGHWTPCIHFTLTSLDPGDILMASFYNEFHPQAPFQSFFVVSRLLPSGVRRTISFGGPQATPEGEDSKRLAKLYSKEGIRGEEYDIEWVPFETLAMRDVLAREFGFQF